MKQLYSSVFFIHINKVSITIMILNLKILTREATLKINMVEPV